MSTGERMNKSEYQKERYNSRKQAGLCVGCGKELDRSGVYCIECAKKRNSRQKENRNFYKENRICPACGKNILTGKIKRCLDCKEKRQGYYWKKEKYISDEEKRRRIKENYAAEKKRKEKRLSTGLCVKCGKRKHIDGIQMCEICREKANRGQRERKHRQGTKSAEEFLEERKMRADNGFCFLCGKKSMDGQRVCAEHYAALWTVTHLPQVQEAREKNKINFGNGG